jgi:hypothetical protein
MIPPQSPRIDPPPADAQSLTRELARCGWTPLDDQGRRLLLLDLASLTPGREEELFTRFLNVSMEVRLALSAAQLMGAPEWVLLLTHQRLDLYRLPEETCEQRATTQAEYESELLPALAALAGGRQEAVRGGPQHLPGAESLGEWLRLWSLQLAALVEAPTSAVERMIWKWILMLQVARRSEGSEAAAGWGLRCSTAGDTWSIAYEAPTATEELGRQLELFDQTFQTRLFGVETERQLAWLKFLEDNALIDRLRAELLMHTQERMAPETVAWLFTDLAREQKGWQREVGGLEPIRKRFQHDSWNIFRPLVCNVGQHGLLSALRDAERLGQYLNDLNLYIRQRRASGSEAPLVQPDLFCPNPRGIGPTGLLDDGVNFLLGDALRLKGVPEEERFGVGVTFLLQMLSFAQRLDWPFLGIDTLDHVFVDE